MHLILSYVIMRELLISTEAPSKYMLAVSQYLKKKCRLRDNTFQVLRPVHKIEFAPFLLKSAEMENSI